MLNRFLSSILQKGLTISPAELDKLSRYGYLEQNNVTRAYEYLVLCSLSMHLLDNAEIRNE